MDGQTESGRQTRRHVRGGMLPAGEAGEREHLPAGLRSSHGFCESGSPPTPVAGQEGPRRCQRVRGLTNGSTCHHLKPSQMSVINPLTHLHLKFTLRVKCSFVLKKLDLKRRLFSQSNRRDCDEAGARTPMTQVYTYE